MSAVLPFDRDDLPRASRTVDAPIAEVFATIAAVEHWPSWVPDVIEPVITKPDDRFVFRSQRTNGVDHFDARVIVRGPTHAFAVELEGRARVYFRTRPHPPGTSVDLVVEALTSDGPWKLLGRNRRRIEGVRRLERILERLAAHLEQPAVDEPT